MTPIRTTCLTGLLASALLSAGPGVAQEGPGGALVSLDLGLGYSLDTSERRASESVLSARLGLGYSSETRSQRLAFSTAALAEITDGDIGIATTDADFAYAIFNRDTELSFDLSQRQTDLGDPAAAPDFDALTATTGQRQTRSATLALITGQTTRFGTDTRLTYSDIGYSGAVSSDLVESETQGLATTLRFDVSGQITLRAFGSWSETTRQTAPQETETRTTAGLGGTFLITPVWTADVDLGWSMIETEAGATLREQDGLDVSASLVRDLANGSAQIDLSRAVTPARTIDTLTLRRALSLGNGAELSGSVGVVDFGTDTVAAFGLSYSQEVLAGQSLSASLSQTGAASGSTDTQLNTQFDLGYRQDLSPVSFFGASLTASSAEAISGSGADSARAGLSLEYGHEVVRDWSLVGRFDHSRTYSGGSQTDRRNLLSINLERSFSYRP